MLGYWLVILISFCPLNSTSALRFLKVGRRNQTLEIRPIEENNNPVFVNGVLYKTFKKYYCSVWNNADDLHTLVRGNEGWTFVRQDVNLTLVYPSDGIAAEDDDYVITGYQIIMFMDGSDSQAYISSGGVLEEYISFTFICKNITTLSYQFWLYGSKRSRLPSREPINLC